MIHPYDTHATGAAVMHSRCFYLSALLAEFLEVLLRLDLLVERLEVRLEHSQLV